MSNLRRRRQGNASVSGAQNSDGSSFFEPEIFDPTMSAKPTDEFKPAVENAVKNAPNSVVQQQKTVSEPLMAENAPVQSKQNLLQPPVNNFFAIPPPQNDFFAPVQQNQQKVAIPPQQNVPFVPYAPVQPVIPVQQSVPVVQPTSVQVKPKHIPNLDFKEEISDVRASTNSKQADKSADDFFDNPVEFTPVQPKAAPSMSKYAHIKDKSDADDFFDQPEIPVITQKPVPQKTPQKQQSQQQIFEPSPVNMYQQTPKQALPSIPPPPQTYAQPKQSTQIPIAQQQPQLQAPTGNSFFNVPVFVPEVSDVSKPTFFEPSKPIENVKNDSVSAPMNKISNFADQFMKTITVSSIYEPEQPGSMLFTAQDDFFSDFQLFPLNFESPELAIIQYLKAKLTGVDGFLKMVLQILLLQLTGDYSILQMSKEGVTRSTQEFKAGFSANALQTSVQSQEFDLALLLTRFQTMTVSQVTEQERQIYLQILAKYQLTECDPLIFSDIYIKQTDKPINFKYLLFFIATLQDRELATFYSQRMALILLQRNQVNQALLMLQSVGYILEPVNIYNVLCLKFQVQPTIQYTPLDFCFYQRQHNIIRPFEVHLAEFSEYISIRKQSKSFISILKLNKLRFWPYLQFYKIDQLIKTNNNQLSCEYLESVLVRLKFIVRTLPTIQNNQKLGTIQSVGVKTLKLDQQVKDELTVFQQQFQKQQKVQGFVNITDYVCLNVYDQNNIMIIAEIGKEMFSLKQQFQQAGINTRLPIENEQLLLQQDSEMVKSTSEKQNDDDGVIGKLAGLATKGLGKLFK
ncbi:Conserved_hypothetical protein [Hexamita inflata]|uniref:Uncharacterized protein n=1 Tax=Hexamita inflata TaxID=28002 RepID=A0AA86QXR1_9EUKA|nr:Conserved hypothetical protein [Hexamita inflata]CAI9963231.1 Conserved hypothetical protein [Hexamita inflata]